MFEAFKVGVKLSLVNDVSAGLLLLTGQFNRLDQQLTGTRRHLTAIELQMKRLQTMGMVGGAFAGAGALGLMALKGPIDAAKDYETAYTRFTTLNMGAAVNQQADLFARATRAFGASSKDLMETLRESVGMFGGMPNALKIAPMLAELNAANSFLFGEKAGKLDDHAIKSIMRFNDMRGLTDSPEDFKRGLNLAQRMYTGSGGMIKFQDLEQLAKRGGTAFKGMSDDGVMMMASMLQEMGGNASGTALMSAYQNLVAGRTTKKTMSALATSGLATLGEVNTGTVGGKKSTATVISSIVDQKMLRENLPLWLMTYAAPAAVRMGAKNDSEVAAFINSILSNRTGSNMGTLFTTQTLQVMRDFTLAKNAMGVDQTIAAGKNTTVGREAELRARYNSLQTELGTVILPVVNKGLQLLVGLCSRLVTFTREFPLLTKVMVGTFAVLAGLAAAGGVLVLAKAAFSALALVLGGGGVGLVGAIGAATTALGAAGLAGVLGKAGLAGAAAFAIVQVGRLGSALYDLWNAKNHDGVNLTADAKARLNDPALALLDQDFKPKDSLPPGGMGATGGRKPYNFGQPAPEKPLHVRVQSVLDGKVIADVTTMYQAKELARPATGGRNFDPSMFARTAGATGAF